MTRIRWTDQTRNPIAACNLENKRTGWYCTKISPGCAHCYAETFNNRFGNGLPYRADVMSDVEMFLDTTVLEKLIRQRVGKKTFLCSMTDLFHPLVTFEMLDQVFACMALCPQHTFQILTKRPARALEYFRSRENGFVDGPDKAVWDFLHLMQGRNGLLPHLFAAGWRIETTTDPDGFRDVDLNYYGALPLPNVWIGTSVENQKAADERIPILLQIPAAVRFLSCEPLLEEIDLNAFLDQTARIYVGDRTSGRLEDVPLLHWLIVGGESGPDFRAMNLDWARLLRDQCAAANVAFFYKQASAYRSEREPLLDGRRWEQFPNHR